MAKLIFLVAFVACSALYVVASEVAEEGEISTINATEAQQKLEQGNFAFTGQFFNQVVKVNPGTSVITSPFSVLVPLAQLDLYAKGESFNQLSSALNLYQKNEIRSAFQSILKSYLVQENVEFKLAQKIWANLRYALSDAFKTDSKDVFSAEAENVDFSQSKETADIINAWVEAQTNNRIKDLVSPDMLNADTRLALTNAIYFKGDWVHQFNPNDTTDRDFHVNSSKTIKAKTMYQSGSFGYAESDDLDAQILELPYKGGNFTFLAILPKTVEGLAGLVAKLQNSGALNAAINALQTEEVNIYLPSMEVSTTTNLADILFEMNIKRIFNATDSGLDGILKVFEPLYISTAIQKAFIIVNEVGSEAAAANVFVGATITSVGIPRIPKVFDADHPFLYYILLRKNPLFCGTYYGK